VGTGTAGADGAGGLDAVRTSARGGVPRRRIASISNGMGGGMGSGVGSGAGGGAQSAMGHLLREAVIEDARLTGQSQGPGPGLGQADLSLSMIVHNQRGARVASDDAVQRNLGGAGAAAAGASGGGASSGVGSRGARPSPFRGPAHATQNALPSSPPGTGVGGVDLCLNVQTYGPLAVT
jgi:hypothetical protein